MAESISQPDTGRHTSLQDDSSQASPGGPTRSASSGDLPQRPRKKERVQFTPSGESLDASNQRSRFDIRDSQSNPPMKPLPGIRMPQTAGHSRDSYFPKHILDTDISADVTESPHISPTGSTPESEDEEGNGRSEMNSHSQYSAQERAMRLANMVSHSAPGSRSGSLDVSPHGSPPRHGQRHHLEEIPMEDLGHRRHYDESTDDDEDGPTSRRSHTAEAHDLVRSMTRGHFNPLNRVHASPGLQSGQVTPVEEQDPDFYVPKPKDYRRGILSTLLKLYDNQGMGAALGSMPSGPGVQPRHYRPDDSGDQSTGSQSPKDSKNSSGRNTPRSHHTKWYDKAPALSTSSLAGLLSSSGAMMASPGASFSSTAASWKKKPGQSRKGSAISAAMDRMKRPRLEDEIHITVHIAETLSRQKYLIKLCHALMSYGAPTHRLEEYMRMTARVLEINSQYLYLPGTMIISFDDAQTHTAEVRLVRTAQGVDLGRLHDVHDIYKEVVHDKIGVEEATQRLDAIIKSKPRYPTYVLVLMYGFASASVGPFAFQMRPIDMPFAFILGCLLGVLQLVLAPKSDLYNNVFEISAAVATSFLARAFGSIRLKDGSNPFCFSALAQSSIALILPGYMILTSSLELQSRSIIAGSVRMVYAIIYSLFLGFGITIGTAIYGLIDPHATSAVTCPVPDYSARNPYLLTFPFVPLFTLCLIVINQAKWKQAPIMLGISIAGYVVNFFSVRRFTSNTQVANTLGALTIGVLGNLYSRLRHGVAAAALLPAIFVQVPSGLAASGSLISGVASADQITGNATGNGTVPANGSQAEQQGLTVNIGYGMIQVSIGITVGLFLSALMVYPFGKKRSGLFSF